MCSAEIGNQPWTDTSRAHDESYLGTRSCEVDAVLSQNFERARVLIVLGYVYIVFTQSAEALPHDLKPLSAPEALQRDVDIHYMLFVKVYSLAKEHPAPSAGSL